MLCLVGYTEQGSQQFGRLPWLAAFLRRSLRLRPRMPMMDSFTYD